MVSDLHLAHPTPSRLHIIPTTRDSATGLALSSRNAHLTAKQLAYAPALYEGLRAAAEAWDQGLCKGECIARAREALQEFMERVAQDDGGLEGTREGKVDVVVDYIEMNDAESFDPLLDSYSATRKSELEEGKGKGKGKGRAVILSGAMWVGKTRLIDNVLLGENGTILST